MADGLEEAGLRFVTEGEAAFKQAVAGTQSATTGLYDTLDKSPAKANVMQAALTGAFTAISNVALDAMRQAGQAVVSFVTDSVGLAGDFQQGMSVLGAASGASNEELKKLRQTSIDLGNDLELPNTSAKNAADAMTELVKAGLSVNDTMAAAKGTLQLAAAAQISEADAAAITANALNTFHLKGTEATKMADLLSAGANASSASITDLADGFKQAGFIFQASNQDADDLVTAISMLTNVGLTGSDAGTALKNALVKLNAPTEQGAKLMDSLGINVFDAQGKMKPMRDIIGILNEKLGGMTDEQRNAALNTIFLSDGMKAIIPLLDAGQQGFDAMNVKINEQGAAAKMAGAQTDGFKGAQAALQSQMETLQLIIGEKLLPILTDLFKNVLSPAITTVMGIVDAFFKAGESGASFQESLEAAIPGVSGVFDTISAVAAELTPVFQTIYTAVSGYVSAIVSYISAGFAEVQKFLAAHGDEIMAVFKAAWDTIKTIIEFAAFVYNKLISPAIEQVAKNIRDHSKEIQAIFTVVWTVIRTVISTALNLIQGIIKVVMALINGDIDGAMKIIQQTITTIWNDIKKAVEDIVSALKNAIGTQFEQIKTSISTAISGALQAVKDQVNSWITVGKSLIEGIVEGIRQAAQGLYDFLRGVIINAILTAISGLPTFLQDEIKRLLGISGATLNGYSGTGRGRGYGGGVVYGGATYNLNVIAQPSMGVVSDFAIMKAWGG